MKRPKTIVTPEGITTITGQQMASEGGPTKVQKTASVKKKATKNLLSKNEAGEILYPIIVNNSLVIQNLGTIDFQRPLYHTEKNLFPIGFKSLRE
jgi:hypothetical protein